MITPAKAVMNEADTATTSLRWSKDGKLQQMWIGHRGTTEWRDVPTEAAERQ